MESSHSHTLDQHEAERQRSLETSCLYHDLHTQERANTLEVKVNGVMR